MSKWFLVLAAVLCLGTTAAHAEDGGSAHSGGGDKRCAEFYDIAVEIAMALVKTGQPAIDRLNPLIRVDLTWERVKKLVVTPHKNLPRQAITDFKVFTTKLDVKQWDRIHSRFDKIRLVAHELMVLTEAESEGMYAVSKDLIFFFTGSKYGVSAKVESYIVHNDGSCTLFRPFYLSESIRTGYASVAGSVNRLWAGFAEDSQNYRDGVCKYLGFESALTMSRERIYNISSVLLSEQGDYVGQDSDHEGTVILSIKCR